MADPAQWFDALGTCRCGKKATGILRGLQNQSMGPYCEPCAMRRIKTAQKERGQDAHGRQLESRSL